MLLMTQYKDEPAIQFSRVFGRHTEDVSSIIIGMKIKRYQLNIQWAN